MARLLKKQGLQALDPLAALKSFLPRALREVLLNAACATAVLVACSAVPLLM